MRGGAHPVYGANGVIGWHDMGHYDHEVVALGCRGSCGSVHIAPPGAWLANNAMALWPRESGAVLTRFLGLAMEAADLVTSGVVSGQVQPQITRTSLAGLQLPVPPVHVQRRIVDLINAFDAVVGTASAVSMAGSAALRLMVRSHFETEGVERRALADVVTFASGYAFPIKHQGKSGPIPFFKVSDMNQPGNEVNLSAAANYVDDATLRDIRAKAWPAGTVVFPKVGAALLTEKRRVLGTRAAFDNNVMGLLPGTAITSRYLYWFMTSVKLGEVAQSGALPSVNQGHLSRLRIPVPNPDDQERFLARADALQGVVQAAELVAESASAARDRLLRDLLSGDELLPDSYDRFLEGAA
jgi:hypothetical protein